MAYASSLMPFKTIIEAFFNTWMKTIMNEVETAARATESALNWRLMPLAQPDLGQLARYPSH